MRIARYDRIGNIYNAHRQADPRWVIAIEGALGLSPPDRIADIGAGTGNYSRALAERGFAVDAVEPSRVMREQSVSHGNLHSHEGSAEAIPLPAASVSGAICTLAAHHFDSLEQAAREIERICPAGPLVVLTIDPRLGERFWFAEYFPEIYERWFTIFPPIEAVASAFCDFTGWTYRVTPLALYADCVDLTAHCGWNRPERYLSEEIRAGTSAFALADPREVQTGVERLMDHLRSGKWDRKLRHLRTQSEIDLGFRIIRCSRDAGSAAHRAEQW